jgi:RNA polymerase sigma-70 factor (ECF subfamily)
MMAAEPRREELAEELIELYPRAVPVVYGFLVARCGSVDHAEELTAETFMAAVSAVQAGAVETITTPWLIVVARRRLVDHWRHQEVEQRHLRGLGEGVEQVVDPWEEHLDAALARGALLRLSPQYRAAITLRYLDDLSVGEVAEYLGRGVHATEALLQRARAALRQVYLEERATDVD